MEAQWTIREIAHIESDFSEKFGIPRQPEFDKSFLSSGSPPQITSYPLQYTTLFPCRKAAAPFAVCRTVALWSMI